MSATDYFEGIHSSKNEMNALLARAESAESALSLLTAKLAQCEEKADRDYSDVMTKLIDAEIEVKALTAAHAKALEDGKRMDWLESGPSNQIQVEADLSARVFTVTSWPENTRYPYPTHKATNIRAAIDAAIAASAPATNGKEEPKIL